MLTSGSQNQTPWAGGARLSWSIAHVGEGKHPITSAGLRLDPLMGQARGVSPGENSVPLIRLSRADNSFGVSGTKRIGFRLSFGSTERGIRCVGYILFSRSTLPRRVSWRGHPASPDIKTTDAGKLRRRQKREV